VAPEELPLREVSVAPVDPCDPLLPDEATEAPVDAALPVLAPVVEDALPLLPVVPELEAAPVLPEEPTAAAEPVEEAPDDEELDGPLVPVPMELAELMAAL
jgi:hypothetical protein